ncbi:MAG: hypothetical protein WA940_10655 [Sphingopyxis sp.]
MNDRTGDRYAFLQFIKAKESGQAEKARSWSDVLSGILTGELKIGSRKPVQGMPAWATPQVLRGGFATGAYAAGGALLPHELTLAEELKVASTDIATVRTALNRWFLSDDGLSRLSEWIEVRRYEADTPEEMALVCVTLLADPDPETATAILGEIAPYFDRLRFYPRPRDSSRPEGLHVRTVEQLRAALKGVQPRKEILVQNASLTIWMPLYDRLMDLLDAQDGPPNVERAKAWLDDYMAADKTHMAKRWGKTGSRFQRCRHILAALAKGRAIEPKDERFLDKHRDDYFGKYGRGEELEAYRKAQRSQIVRDMHDALAKIMIGRLSECDATDGLSDIGAVIAPITEDEVQPAARVGASMPPSIIRKARLAQLGSVEALIENGQIRSPETLGNVLPGLAGQLYCKQFDDPRHGFAYASAYEAFHRRRSLLLLNLESQIRLKELPWIAALARFQKSELGKSQPELDLLDRLVTLLITHFPQVQFPNPVVEQMQVLAKRAALKTPFVSEIAADIFMGRFSEPFGLAAAKTAEYFEGTLYARYYKLPKKISPKSFDQLCVERVGTRPSQGWSVAYNAMVLEQAMILTSHNLATVFEQLPLREVNFGRAATASFEWIAQNLQKKPPHRHARLIAIKQSAYAWRQMVAYLSRLEKNEQLQAYATMRARLATCPADLQVQLGIMLGRLGEKIENQHKSFSDRGYFLGWTMGSHPLMSE